MHVRCKAAGRGTGAGGGGRMYNRLCHDALHGRWWRHSCCSAFLGSLGVQAATRWYLLTRPEQSISEAFYLQKRQRRKPFPVHCSVTFDLNPIGMQGVAKIAIARANELFEAVDRTAQKVVVARDKDNLEAGNRTEASCTAPAPNSPPPPPPPRFHSPPNRSDLPRCCCSRERRPRDRCCSARTGSHKQRWQHTILEP